MSATEIRDDIAYPYDGPVTCFVLIARAIRHAAENPTDADATAEALQAELDARGYTRTECPF